MLNDKLYLVLPSNFAFIGIACNRQFARTDASDKNGIFTEYLRNIYRKFYE